MLCIFKKRIVVWNYCIHFLYAKQSTGEREGRIIKGARNFWEVNNWDVERNRERDGKLKIY